MTVHSLPVHRALRAWQDAMDRHGIGRPEEREAWEEFQNLVGAVASGAPTNPTHPTRKGEDP